MSDDQTRSPEPLAQVEPEADYFRRTMRTIRHWLDELDLSGASQEVRDKTLNDIRLRTVEALNRPRSNGKAIDRLERELAELRGKIIDFDIVAQELKEARIWHSRATEAEEALARLRGHMGPAESAICATIGASARRVDRWLAGR